ncbi:hypothetical protein THMIRHAM_04640 [Thiomicrorhabdus immobilis]|uniref:Uncharacterized protein n=1 Tax=Thiomicrorhabdus immobilis TaxID=2791037 RepID=A0ABN6CVR6_9GAMM|nr:hypothetical protein THMIRHAM_04640 [Thiomicrorhabdus immobilis]
MEGVKAIERINVLKTPEKMVFEFCMLGIPDKLYAHFNLSINAFGKESYARLFAI